MSNDTVNADSSATYARQSDDAALAAVGYEPQLRRSLGFGSILVYGLLFFVPMAPVAVFGHVVNLSGGVPVLVYLVAAVVMGLSAVSYREMALRFPVAGSVYGYTRLAVGERWGFVAGWLILLDYLLMPALLTVLSALALGHMVTAVPVWAFALLFVAASLAVNLRGIQVTTEIGLVLLAIQLVVIAMFCYFVIGAVSRGTVSLSLDSIWRTGTSWPAVLSAVSIAALSFLGFDAVATLNEEAKGGGRTVARATLVLLALITFLFSLQLFAASVVSHATSFPAGKTTDRAFYFAVDAVAPQWFQPVFTVTNAFVAIFACLVVAHAATGRLIFAMGRDRVLPRVLSRTNDRGVPAVALTVVAALSAVLSVGFAGQAGLMTSLVTFGALSSYVLLHIAVIVRCVSQEKSRNWLVHLVIPVLGIATLAIALWQAASLTKIVGAIWLAVGVLAHLALTRSGRALPDEESAERHGDAIDQQTQPQTEGR